MVEFKRISKRITAFFPMTSWLPRYTFRYFLRDLIAGITVSLMIIPQGLAYTSIIDLPTEYGLYSAFMGTFMYSLFGPTKEMFLGPSALLCLAAVSYYTDKLSWPTYSITLTFFGGLVQLLMGLLGLGTLVNLISVPVICGFMCSITFSVGASQLPVILGLSDIPRGFFPMVYSTFDRIQESNLWDLSMGVATIAWLVSLKCLDCIHWPDNTSPVLYLQVTKKLVWMISLAKNALAVVLAAVAVLVFEKHGFGCVFSRSSKASTVFSMPAFKLPVLSLANGNSTTSTTQILAELGPGLVVVPLVGFLETVSVAKVFSRINKKNVCARQELIALGVANCLGTFVSSFPICGSFTRAAVSHQSGVATPAAGIVSGCLVLLSLYSLQPYFGYIPKAALAALVLVAVSTLLDLRVVTKIWRTRRIDLLPFFVTFFGCIYRLELGILCGITISLVILLYSIINPKIHSIKEGDISHIRPDGSLTFLGIEQFNTKVHEVVFSVAPPKEIVFDFSSVLEMDFTGLQGIVNLSSDLKEMSVRMRFTGVQEHVCKMLRSVGMSEWQINGSRPDDHSELHKSEMHHYCSSV